MPNHSKHPSSPSVSLNRTSIRNYLPHPKTMIIALILCGLIAVYIWWFLQNFEKVTNTDYALKPQTQYNPYYAAELLINSHQANDTDANSNNDSDAGIASTLLDSDLKALVDDLPTIDTNDVESGIRPTLVINSMGTKLTQERFDVLKQWVEQGGHLITFTSQSTDSKDLSAALERLKTLRQSDSDPISIKEDETLNDLMITLDSGNSFLNQLGIFQVYDEDYDEDGYSSDDIGVELDSIIEELEANQATKKTADNIPLETFTKKVIQELANIQPLSLVVIPKSPLLPSQSDAFQSDTLMVEIEHEGRLNSELFQALHPDSQRVAAVATKSKDTDVSTSPLPSDKAISKQADLIRRYIIESQTILKQTAKTDAIRDSATPTKDSNTEQERDRLPELLTAMLALEDKALVGLFVPMQDVYQDLALGKGRISVINGTDVFSNPNPNLESLDLELTDSEIASGEGENVLRLSALHELLDTGYEISLLSADNAALLIALTANSSEVWILPNTDIDALPIMLWKEARGAVLGLGLLALLWLWALYNRFGKMSVLPTNHNQDIMRYFRQVGRYGWHYDEAKKLTQVTRDKVQTLLNEQFNHNVTKQHDQQTLLNPYAMRNASLQSGLSVDEIHTELLKCLDKKRQQTLSTPNTADYSQADNNSQLLIDNEAYLRSTISIDRLKAAFEHTNSNQAMDFTEMTQTLWTIQWLLK